MVLVELLLMLLVLLLLVELLLLVDEELEGPVEVLSNEER